mmetsp:Transcript_43241/g.123696  ORF Transcript_43241/g.123696 Transcript_43241/m.123696 type:complete len:200 (-) Transcript_43241:1167-1766(-)
MARAERHRRRQRQRPRGPRCKGLLLRHHNRHRDASRRPTAPALPVAWQRHPTCRLSQDLAVGERRSHPWPSGGGAASLRSSGARRSRPCAALPPKRPRRPTWPSRSAAGRSLRRRPAPAPPAGPPKRPHAGPGAAAATAAPHRAARRRGHARHAAATPPRSHGAQRCSTAQPDNREGCRCTGDVQRPLGAIGKAPSAPV